MFIEHISLLFLLGDILNCVTNGQSNTILYGKESYPKLQYNIRQANDNMGSGYEFTQNSALKREKNNLNLEKNSMEEVTRNERDSTHGSKTFNSRNRNKRTIARSLLKDIRKKSKETDSESNIINKLQSKKLNKKNNTESFHGNIFSGNSRQDLSLELMEDINKHLDSIKKGKLHILVNKSPKSRAKRKFVIIDKRSEEPNKISDLLEKTSIKMNKKKKQSKTRLKDRLGAKNVDRPKKKRVKLMFIIDEHGSNETSSEIEDSAEESTKLNENFDGRKNIQDVSRNKMKATHVREGAMKEETDDTSLEPNASSTLTSLNQAVSSNEYDDSTQTEKEDMAESSSEANGEQTEVPSVTVLNEKYSNHQQLGRARTERDEPAPSLNRQPAKLPRNIFKDEPADNSWKSATALNQQPTELPANIFKDEPADNSMKAELPKNIFKDEPADNSMKAVTALNLPPTELPANIFEDELADNLGKAATALNQRDSGHQHDGKAQIKKYEPADSSLEAVTFLNQINSSDQHDGSTKSKKNRPVDSSLKAVPTLNQAYSSNQHDNRSQIEKNEPADSSLEEVTALNQINTSSQHDSLSQIEKNEPAVEEEAALNQIYSSNQHGDKSQIENNKPAGNTLQSNVIQTERSPIEGEPADSSLELNTQETESDISGRSRYGGAYKIMRDEPSDSSLKSNEHNTEYLTATTPNVKTKDEEKTIAEHSLQSTGQGAKLSPETTRDQTKESSEFGGREKIITDALDNRLTTGTHEHTQIVTLSSQRKQQDSQLNEGSSKTYEDKLDEHSADAPEGSDEQIGTSYIRTPNKTNENVLTKSVESLLMTLPNRDNISDIFVSEPSPTKLIFTSTSSSLKQDDEQTELPLFPNSNHTNDIFGRKSGTDGLELNVGPYDKQTELNLITVKEELGGHDDVSKERSRIPEKILGETLSSMGKIDEHSEHNEEHDNDIPKGRTSTSEYIVGKYRGSPLSQFDKQTELSQTNNTSYMFGDSPSTTENTFDGPLVGSQVQSDGKNGLPSVTNKEETSEVFEGWPVTSKLTLNSSPLSLTEQDDEQNNLLPTTIQNEEDTTFRGSSGTSEFKLNASSVSVPKQQGEQSVISHIITKTEVETGDIMEGRAAIPNSNRFDEFSAGFPVVTSKKNLNNLIFGGTPAILKNISQESLVRPKGGWTAANNSLQMRNSTMTIDRNKRCGNSLSSGGPVKDQLSPVLHNLGRGFGGGPKDTCTDLNRITQTGSDNPTDDPVINIIMKVGNIVKRPEDNNNRKSKLNIELNIGDIQF